MACANAMNPGGARVPLNTITPERAVYAYTNTLHGFKPNPVDQGGFFVFSVPTDVDVRALALYLRGMIQPFTTVQHSVLEEGSYITIDIIAWGWIPQLIDAAIAVLQTTNGIPKNRDLWHPYLVRVHAHTCIVLQTSLRPRYPLEVAPGSRPVSFSVKMSEELVVSSFRAGWGTWTDQIRRQMFVGAGAMSNTRMCATDGLRELGRRCPRDIALSYYLVKSPLQSRHLSERMDGEDPRIDFPCDPRLHPAVDRDVGAAAAPVVVVDSPQAMGEAATREGVGSSPLSKRGASPVTERSSPHKVLSPGADQDSGLCNVCFDRISDIFQIPCHHVVMCEVCYDKMCVGIARGAAVPCVVCRAPIQECYVLRDEVVSKRARLD